MNIEEIIRQIIREEIHAALERKPTNWNIDNEYPEYLNAKMVSKILSCSLRNAYEIMNRADFPLIQIGRTKRVKRESFFSWLDQMKS